MNKGFSTLFSVIILGSIVLSISIFIATGNLWAIRESSETKDYVRAKVLLDGCAEIVLDQIRQDNSYTGSGTQTIGGKSCIYSVTNSGGDVRTVLITGVVGSITRKLQIVTSGFNPLKVSSWSEII